MSAFNFLEQREMIGDALTVIELLLQHNTGAVRHQDANEHIDYFSFVISLTSFSHYCFVNFIALIENTTLLS